MYFKYVFQLLVFQLLHNTETNSERTVLNNTKTQFRPKLLFSAISQTHKSLENSQDFFVKTKTKTFTSRPRPRPRLWVSRPRSRLYFLSSRRLETKTLVSRTTLLAFIEVPYTQGAQVRITQCYLQTTPYLPLPRKHSPDGASQTGVAESNCNLLLIYLPERMKG